jgi:arginine N-succinyltransferase
MFIIRSATHDDLKSVQRLAAVLNTVNLPNDAGALKGLIDLSARSFSGKVRDPFEREYLFVMEDTEAKSDARRIIGTSQIIAQHGTREAPHIYFDVLDEERYSETIDKHFRHKVLRIGFDYDGPTEIGGLVLDPDYRRTPGKLGKQLSFVRFLFIAMHRAQFRDRVLAELLPPLGENGRSALWEALGRRFTGMSYLEADRVSKTNKEFIKNLFPSGLIYASLFDQEAQDVLGKVGPQTEGVKKMLMSVGFEPLGRIDPFDGGPHFEAKTEDIWPVTHAKKAKAVVVDRGIIVDSPGESADGLVGFEPPPTRQKKLGRFRCVQTEFRFRDGDKLIDVATDAAEALGLEDGDKVWALAMTRHTRL